jgi:hypothetical protein
MLWDGAGVAPARRFGLQSVPAFGLNAQEPPQGLRHDRRENRAMAGIGQGWIEEAVPTRDGALMSAALLPIRSILLLTSP